MNFIKYPLFVLLSLIATLLTYVVAPLLVLTTGADGNLPRCLYWFQTFDATLDAGWIYSYFVPSSEPKPTGFALYWMRLRWLWRNPAYGFDYFPFGAAFDETQWTVTQNDALKFSASGPSGAFNFEYGGPLGEYKFGWKAKNYYDQAGNAWKPGFVWGPQKRVPLCFTLSPFKRS